jgi:hypothetical protein
MSLNCCKTDHTCFSFNSPPQNPQNESSLRANAGRREQGSVLPRGAIRFSPLRQQDTGPSGVGKAVERLVREKDLSCQSGISSPPMAALCVSSSIEVRRGATREGEAPAEPWARRGGVEPVSDVTPG